ncbi:putative baseplate assembly protein [Streptomyces olivoreticuli]
MAKDAPPIDRRTPEELRSRMADKVVQSLPGWTTGVGEPGTALLETVARMAEQLAVQLNRTPDKNITAVLAAMGSRPIPPSPARGTVVFTLASADLATSVTVPRGTQISTQPVGDTPPTVFTTTSPSSYAPQRLLTSGFLQEHTAGPSERGTLRGTLHSPGSGTPLEDAPFVLVLERPAPGEWVTIGLAVTRDSALDSCAPATPLADDWIWEVPTAPQRRAEPRWTPCDTLQTTASSHRSGKQLSLSVRLRLPEGHSTMPVLLDAPDSLSTTGDRALLRIRSPRGLLPRTLLEARGIRTTPRAPVVQGSLVPGTDLGVSNGLSDQRFALPAPPQTAVWPLELHVTTQGATTAWTYVPSLVFSGPEDTHFTLDPTDGTVLVALQAPHQDGTHQHGAIPARGSRLAIAPYLTGGGADGNVPAGSLTLLPTPLPNISAVTNEEACTGGADGETPEQATARAPSAPVNPDRAVSGADYERIARQAAAGVARARVLPAQLAIGTHPAPRRTLQDARPATADLTFLLDNPISQPDDVIVPPGTTVWPDITTDSSAVPFLTDEPLPLRLALGQSTATPAGASPWTPPSPSPAARTTGIQTGTTPATLLTAIPSGFPLHQATLVLHTDLPTPTTPPLLTVRIHHTDGTTTTLAHDRTFTPAPTPGHQGRHLCALRLTDTPGWTTATRRPLAHTPSDAFPDQAGLTAMGFPAHGAAWLTCTLAPAPRPGTEPPPPTPPLLRIAVCRNAASVTAHQIQVIPAGTPLMTAGTPPRPHLPAWPVSGTPPTITATGRNGTRTWAPVKTLCRSSPDDRHVLVDSGTGALTFGEQISQSDGSVRHYGTPGPTPSAELTVNRPYHVTQGNAGNVPAGTLTLHTLSTTGLTVTNPRAACGGADAVLDNTPGIVPDLELLIVPHVAADERGYLEPELLEPQPALIASVKTALARVQPPGLIIRLSQARFRAIAVKAALETTGADSDEIQNILDQATRALNDYFNPLTGGPTGEGWPFGRAVHSGEAHRILQTLPGVRRVHDLQICIEPENGEPTPAPVSFTIEPDELIRSGIHEITDRKDTVPAR